MTLSRINQPIPNVYCRTVLCISVTDSHMGFLSFHGNTYKFIKSIDTLDKSLVKNYNISKVEVICINTALKVKALLQYFDQEKTDYLTQSTWRQTSLGCLFLKQVISVKFRQVINQFMIFFSSLLIFILISSHYCKLQFAFI